MPNDLYLSPLIVKYEAILEANKRSLVFAPLAELYRKLGHLDKALATVKSGLRYHPNYITGHISLAACHLDGQEAIKAYDILVDLVPQNRDNIKLQKLFAQACSMLNRHEEALETYKTLHFIVPHNPLYREEVAKLEEIIAQKDSTESYNPTTVSAPELNTDSANNINNWAQLPLPDNELSNAIQEEQEFNNEWTVGQDPMNHPLNEASSEENGHKLSAIIQQYLSPPSQSRPSEKSSSYSKIEKIQKIKNGLMRFHDAIQARSRANHS